MTSTLAERGAGLLGARPTRVLPIAGGDLSEVVAIDLDDGRTAIVKSGPKPATEAGMLAAIRATGTPAPVVLAHDETTLVLERLQAGGRIDDAWYDLGAALASLHAAGRDGRAQDSAAGYGWPVDYAFGAVAIENGQTRDWAEFWAERRLRNQLVHLPRSIAVRVDAVAAALPDRLPAAPRPALLHGDLWGGNILVSDGQVSGLIDPACYYGHREVDFAMLRLFDRPARALFDAYGDLEPNFEERLPIYQLWPALVHLRLFGAGYRPLVERLLAAAGV
jgi:fructosamine-3-kinase